MPVSGNYGTPGNPNGDIYSSYWELQWYTGSDPAHVQGDMWGRSDLTTGDRIATIRVDHYQASGLWDIPVFPTSAAASGGVKDVLGIQTPNGEGWIPLWENEGQYKQLGYQHASVRHGVHDRTVGVPQIGKYLDDWADNKLSSRNSYTTTYLANDIEVPAASDYSLPTRAEWTIEIGASGISAQNNRLEMDGSIVQHLYYTDAVATGTWEIDFTSQSTRAFGENCTFCVLDQDPTDWDSNDGVPDNGYALEIRGSAFRLLLRVNGNNDHAVIDGIWDNDTNPHTAKITRDASGNFELFYDGSSIGTGTDTTFTSTAGTGIGMDVGPAMYWDNLRVY